VAEEGCGEFCRGNSKPDANGKECRDDSKVLEPVLMMKELKEVLRSQLVNLREALDTSFLGAAIRDIEQIPSIAGFAEKDYKLMTEALTNLYNVQNSDIVLETYFAFLKESVNKRINRIEGALEETQSGNNKMKSVLRNIKYLYNDFVYKIKDLNDEIMKKRDYVTVSLAKITVFDAMLNSAKQNRKKTISKSDLVDDLTSTLIKDFFEVKNEYKRNGTEKALKKAFDSVPNLIRIGFSLFQPSNANREREIRSKIKRSLEAVGTISSKLNSRSWELIETSGSFLAEINKIEELRDEYRGSAAPVVSDDLIYETLGVCSDLKDLARDL